MIGRPRDQNPSFEVLRLWGWDAGLDDLRPTASAPHGMGWVIIFHTLGKDALFSQHRTEGSPVAAAAVVHVDAT